MRAFGPALALALLGSLLGAAPSTGQSWWTLQAGPASNHSRQGAAVVVSGDGRVGSAGSQDVRVQIGLAVGNPDDDFIAPTVGFQVRAIDFGPTANPLSLFFSTGAGFIFEPEYAGALLYGGLGLSWRASSLDELFVEGRLGRHDGRTGPGMVTLGVSLARVR